MKTIVAVLVLLLAWVTVLGAAQRDNSVTVDFKNLTVTGFSTPRQGEGRPQALVEAVFEGGKERFGLGGMGAGEKVLEILDAKGTVLKSLSAAELFGGKGPGGFSAGQTEAGERRIIRLASLSLPNGKVQVILRAIAVGDAKTDNAGQHLVMTAGLKANAAMTLALRMTMKSIGELRSGDQGFVLMPKTGAAALNVGIFPTAATVSAAKGRIVVASPAIVLDGVSEAPAFWMIVDGGTAPTQAAAEAAALKTLKEKRDRMKDPHLVVISAADKETTQPGDTVTFTMTCTNIGSSGATDVTLSNPVPDGMSYLEGSATSYGCVVSADRSADGVKKLSWTFTDPVEPGGERTVSFKARIR